MAIVNPNHIGPHKKYRAGLHKSCKDKLIDISTESTHTVHMHERIYVWKSFPALLDALTIAVQAPRGDVMIEAAWNEYVRNNPDEVTLVFSKVPVKTNYKVRHFQARCISGPGHKQIFMKLHDVVMYNKNLEEPFGATYVAWTTDWF